ncbi:MAG: response regulator [Holophagales bacterium]|nr:response regulator [Holophagales bacterium]MBK9969153.1 response regulator [Holophagales bacterium]
MSLPDAPGPADGRILLVEDSPDDQTLTIRALRRAGVDEEVTLARDGAEALALLLPAGGGPVVLPRIVLLDLKLPKVQGLEVLERLRSDPRTRDLRVIVVTSSDEEADILASRRFGADGYVRKSVDFWEFCETLRRSWPGWMAPRGPALRGT